MTLARLLFALLLLIPALVPAQTRISSPGGSGGGGGAGVTSITGTSDQVVASSPTGAVTLSTPQNIATTSAPTFGSLTLNGPLTSTAGNSTFSSASGVTVTINSPTADDDVALHVKAASVTPAAPVFKITGSGGGSSGIVAKWIAGLSGGILGLEVNGPAAFGGTAITANDLVLAITNLTDPVATTSTGLIAGRNVILTANNANTVHGLVGVVTTTSGNFNLTNVDGIWGTQGKVHHSTGGVISNGAGIKGLIYNTSTGTITNGDAGFFDIQNLNAAGIITNAYGVRARLNFNLGTITNTYGVYIDDVTSGTQTNQAYGLYQVDAAARNFFAGNLGINTSPTTTSNLIVGSAITDPSAANYGINAARSITLTGATSQEASAGKYTLTALTGNFNLTGTIRGLESTVQHQNTATMSTGFGTDSTIYNVSTGTITNGAAGRFSIQNLNAAGTITNAYGLWVKLGFNIGTLGNTYGLYIDDLTSGTQTNQAWGVYQPDTGMRNYFAGGVLSRSFRASKTGDYPVVAADSGTQFDNIGASGTVVLTLPTAAAGLKYGACVKAAQTLQLTAGASTTISLGASTSAAAGNIASNTPYSCVELEAISTTEWVGKSVTGSWTVTWLWPWSPAWWDGPEKQMEMAA